jgi:hypothetical protein
MLTTSPGHEVTEFFREFMQDIDANIAELVDTGFVHFKDTIKTPAGLNICRACTRISIKIADPANKLEFAKAAQTVLKEVRKNYETYNTKFERAGLVSRRSLGSLQTIEGEALSSGDRVLVKDGTPAAAGDPLAVVVVFAVVVQVVLHHLVLVRNVQRDRRLARPLRAIHPPAPCKWEQKLYHTAVA